MLVTTFTGFENFDTASAKNYVFIVPTRELPRVTKEMHIGVAAKANVGVRLQGAPEHFPAAPGFREETGRWTKAVYDVPEGAILKIFAQRNGGFGSLRILASQLVRIRRDAAYRKVTTVLTGNPNAAFSRVSFEGRFDLLTLEQARPYGILVPPHFATTYDSTMTRRAFEYAELEREVAPQPVQVTQVIENAAGETVEVSTMRRTRALDL